MGWSFRLEDLIKPIDGCPGYYVTRTGDVKYKKSKTEWKDIHQSLDKCGYYRVNMKGTDGRHINREVHRLVAEAFVPKDGYKCYKGRLFVIHKDGDKTYNSANNLIWGTRADMIREMDIDMSYYKNNGRRIAQYTKDGIFVMVFKSMRQASRWTGTNFSSISACCRGRLKTAGGFIWKLYNE